jgi:hypothetical protein
VKLGADCDRYETGSEVTLFLMEGGAGQYSLRERCKGKEYIWGIIRGAR